MAGEAEKGKRSRSRRKPRRPLLSLSEYTRELPAGVSLKWASQMQRYKLSRDGEVLAMRRTDEVQSWKRPARVFASIARRQMRNKT